MYAELTCRSNYTFLTGASSPEELVEQASALGLAALALTDRDGLYGLVKAHEAARRNGLKLLAGAELTLSDAPPLTLIARDGEGYKNLSRLITKGRTARPKGESRLSLGELAGATGGLFAILREPEPWAASAAKALFGERLFLGLCRHLCDGDEERLAEQRAVARAVGLPLVAVNDVHMHAPERQPLQDLLVCIREHCTLATAGFRLFANAERILKSPAEMERLFADQPDALANTLAIARACTFELSQLAYHFPAEELPPEQTPMSWLRALTYEGAARRYPEKGGPPSEVRAQLEHELSVIEALGYPGYFLTLKSIVDFARARSILCQGRGSAANSAVCFCLGITAIDPVRMGLLFERFLSRERSEPPDIDVDFEHERREEVLQHVFEKYGRERAAMVCEVITYRGRSAMRDTAKALGLSRDQADALAGCFGHHSDHPCEDDLRATGLDLTDPTIARALSLASALSDFPRHLSIHTGGFAITQGPLCELVPIENGAMEGRTVVQWDKDDLSVAGILKVDLLALGMLTAIAKCFALMERHEEIKMELATVPMEDGPTYDMLCDADSVGVFQVESRAQMSMLPRLRPRCFYDLVVEVAIVRPGPIVGKAVHPYLNRRDGKEPVTYLHPSFEPILGKTLGLILFQEQAIKLGAAAAGFTLGEADTLRRAMGHKRGAAKLEVLRGRFVEGVATHLGLARERGEALFEQIRGFAGTHQYGFPESHAASFALITYASSYLKRHHPAAFACALLNSQPMGFYSPHTLLDDARRHGVPARPLDVQWSCYDATLERLSEGERSRVESRHAPREGRLAIRLGLRMIRALRAESAERIEHARSDGGPFASLYDLWRRTHLPRAELARLAAASALSSLFAPGRSRREALWEVCALPTDSEELLASTPPPEEDSPNLPALSAAEALAADYREAGSSTNGHPMALFRAELSARRAVGSRQLAKLRAGQSITAAGMCIARQRPPTAGGVFFMTLEDEHGFINVIAMPDIYERYRAIARGALFLLVKGKLERAAKVVNLKASSFEALEFPDALAGGELQLPSYDFR